MFHLSKFPKDSKFFDPYNEKVIGKMKDESKGKIKVKDGSKSKMYSLKDVDGKETKRGKQSQ